MRLPEFILTHPADPDWVCSDCFRRMPPEAMRMVMLTPSALEMMGVDDLPPGWHNFCAGEAIPGCERVVEEAEERLKDWLPQRTISWPSSVERGSERQ